MKKLTRLLIIYNAVAVTILLVINLIILKGAAEQNKKVFITINSLKEDLPKIASDKKSTEEIVEKLDTLKSKLDDITQAKVLGKNQKANDPDVKGGFVTINDKKWQTVDVYETNSYSAKVIGKLSFDEVYQFVKKENSWYQIKLPASMRGELKSEKLGWVAGRFLKEIEDNGPKE